MKKIIFTLTTLLCMSASMYAATDTISASGYSFVPSNLTVNIGDTVLFELSSMHNAVEVSQATWNVNGATSNGGFQVSYGGGSITMTDTGTFYYVCQAHASYGMKGIITVVDTGTTVVPPNTIVNVGNQFSPDTLTIMPGDTVTFSLESMHNAVEVSQATWDANGNTSNGGFQVPFGGGQITLSTPGIHYYVCQTHAYLGMKGIIIVVDTATTVVTPNTIVNVGNQFSPDTLTIMPGDTVTFSLESMHNAVEVSQATWDANGNTSNGGFQVPFGGGQITLSTPGIYYYVCQSHAYLGMKGVIIVMDTSTNVHEVALSGYSMTLYPNPVQKQLYIKGIVPKNINKLSVEIHAVDGRLLKNLSIVAQDGNFSATVNVEKLPSGIYFLNVWNPQIGTIFNKKITIK